AGRSRQTKSDAEANRNRSTTQYGRVNRSVQFPSSPSRCSKLLRATGVSMVIRIANPLICAFVYFGAPLFSLAEERAQMPPIPHPYRNGFEISPVWQQG